MPEALKNVYSPDFFGPVLKAAPFNAAHFMQLVFDEQWSQLELKQRMRHIARVLGQLLPGTYEQQLESITDIIRRLTEQKYRENSFEMMFFPDFIEQYGLNHYEASVKAMETMTQYTSCEFAVRPFILRYPGPMMQQMLQWSTHPHPNVRRFSSEGCRPRLPWAMALPGLKNDPAPVLPILENLKNDESEFVRRSVANNLNDIAKDHPDLVLALARQWQGLSAPTDWVIRHACRTLIKQGRPEALQLFDMDARVQAQADHLSILRPQVKLGEYLHFHFDLRLLSPSPAKLRVEYGINYLKANGSHSIKKFKLTEGLFESGPAYKLQRKQLIKDLTTRKHYPGRHQLIIFINGRAAAQLDFEVLR